MPALVAGIHVFLCGPEARITTETRRTQTSARIPAASALLDISVSSVPPWRLLLGSLPAKNKHAHDAAEEWSTARGASP
jgi:hypothetical protein